MVRIFLGIFKHTGLAKTNWFTASVHLYRAPGESPALEGDAGSPEPVQARSARRC